MSNVSDSLIFLTTLRKTMCEFVDLNEESTKIEKIQNKNFIMNEASDYEVMSLAVEGELPDEKYNSEKEAALFEDVRTCIIENFDTFSQYLSEDVTTDFVSDITALSEYGLSSAAPIANFLLELPYDLVPAGKLKGHTAANFGNRMKARAGYAGKAVKNAPAHVGGAIRSIPGKAKSAASAVRSAPGKAKDFGKGVFGTASTRNPETAHNVSSATVSGEKLRMKAGNTVASGKAAAQNGASAVVAFANSKKGRYIGGALLASLVAYAAYKVYKAKFSAGAKACKGKTGPERQDCLNKFKKAAIQAQIAQLRAGFSGCASTKDPAKCKASIQAKISKLQAKI